MMQARPTGDGGMVVRGDNPWARFLVEFGPDGTVVRSSYEPKADAPKARPLVEKWSRREMIEKYLVARASGRRATPETIALRILSCHGGGEKKPCPSRRVSTRWPGRHFCGSCGCGERRAALLDGGRQHKLQFTRLDCPRRMPGFSNGGG